MFSPFLVCLSLIVTDVQDSALFTDHSRGYAIQYPSFMVLKGGSNRLKPSERDTDYVAVWCNGKLIVKGNFDSIDPELDSTFTQYATRISTIFFASDGPGESGWAENIDSVQVKKNRFGLTYAEVFVRRLWRDAGGERGEIVGPLFFVQISSGDASRTLFLYWFDQWKPTDLQTKAMRAIVDGIRLLHD